jgi:hypothetical protein
MADIDYRQLAQAQAEANEAMLRRIGIGSASGSTGGGSIGGGSTASGGGAAGAMNLVTGAANGLIGGFRSLTTGTANLSGVFDTFGATLGKLGPLGNLVGSVGQNIGQGVIEFNDNLKKVSENGVYFGQNLGLYSTAVANSRMSMAEFNDLIKNNNQSLVGLEGNAEKSALAFLGLAKRLQDDPLTYNLAATGIGLNEFNKALSVAASQQKFQDLSTKQSQDQVLSSAMSLAIELDNVARITGKNRTQLQKEMEERDADIGYKLLKASATGPELQGILRAESISKEFGDQASKVAQIYATGGPMNKTQAQTVAQMDPQMRGFLEQLTKVKGQTPEAEAEREQIRMRMRQRTQEMAADTQSSKNKIALANSDFAGARENAKTQAELVERGNQVKKDEIEANKQNLTLSQYYDKQNEERVKRNTGQQTSEGSAAAVAQTINKGEILIKDAGKGVADELNKLNKSVGSTITTFDGLNKVLRPYSGAEANAIMFGKGKTEAAPKPEVEPKSEKPTTTTPGKPVERATGSYGAVGKFMEDFGKGTPAMLHGKEGVITENQLNGLLSQATGSVKQNANTFEPMSQMKNMLAEATGGMKTSLEASKSSMPDVSMFEKMFSQIKMPDAGEISNAVASRMPQSSASSSNDAMNEVAKGVDQLNMRIERLINAVEDGSSKSVKALKSRGNMIA